MNKERRSELEEVVLQKITPSVEQRQKLNEVVAALEQLIKKELAGFQVSEVEVQLVGSIAKDTFLAHKLDIDFFLLFPTSEPIEVLKKVALGVGRALLESPEECYAEHPYIRGLFQGFPVEIVPCYSIESAEQKLSAVDRTPLHTQYVLSHVTVELKQEILLFKQFLHGIGCYGAEAEIEGFSGYLCELLVLYYRTFDKLVSSAQRWKAGEILSLTEGVFPRFDTPLVFIDPVDETRNVASALSSEKFRLFVHACKSFVEKPGVTFFFPNKVIPWSLVEIQRQVCQQQFVGVVFSKPDVLSENLYPQVRKATRAIQDFCKRYDFSLRDITFFVDDAKNLVYIVLNPESLVLSETLVHKGPPVQKKQNAREFCLKWEHSPRTVKPPFEEDKRLFVEIKREYTHLVDFLRDNLSSLSLGKDINLVVSQEFKVLSCEELIVEDLRLFWTEYIADKYPWEW